MEKEERREHEQDKNATMQTDTSRTLHRLVVVLALQLLVLGKQHTDERWVLA